MCQNNHLNSISGMNYSQEPCFQYLKYCNFFADFSGTLIEGGPEQQDFKIPFRHVLENNSKFGSKMIKFHVGVMI